jgi:hypothetical protein
MMEQDRKLLISRFGLTQYSCHDPPTQSPCVYPPSISSIRSPLSVFTVFRSKKEKAEQDAWTASDTLTPKPGETRGRASTERSLDTRPKLPPRPLGEPTYVSALRRATCRVGLSTAC